MHEKVFRWEKKSTWKIVLDQYLRDHSGSFLLKCNYDVSTLPQTLPKFYQECLCEWVSYNVDISGPSSYSQVLNEIIWNNKFIRINDRPLYRIKIINKGILKLGDILTSDYKLKSFESMKIVGLTNAGYFLLMGIGNAIPKDCMNLLKSQSVLPSDPSSSNTLGSADPPQRISLSTSSRRI